MMQWKKVKHADGNATHTATSGGAGIPTGNRTYVIEERLADDGVWECTLDLWLGDDYVSQPFDDGDLCPFAEISDAMEAAEGLEILDVVRSTEFDGYQVAERELVEFAVHVANESHRGKGEVQS